MVACLGGMGLPVARVVLCLLLLYISILYGKCTVELDETMAHVDAAGSFGVPNNPATAFEGVKGPGTRRLHSSDNV